MSKTAQPKIYFACSIRGGREQANIYPAIVQAIEDAGAVALSEIFADGKLSAAGIKTPSKDIWNKDMSWLSEADAVIAEVSVPSLGVGYEIREAEHQQKPVLALYKSVNGSKLSAMIDGAPGVAVFNYENLEDAVSEINDFIKALKK